MCEPCPHTTLNWSVFRLTGPMNKPNECHNIGFMYNFVNSNTDDNRCYSSRHSLPISSLSVLIYLVYPSDDFGP